jgi:hypothetical protein
MPSLTLVGGAASVAPAQHLQRKTLFFDAGSRIPDGPLNLSVNDMLA